MEFSLHVFYCKISPIQFASLKGTLIHTFGFITLAFNIDIVVFLNVGSSLTFKNEITISWRYVYEHYGA